MIEPHPASPPLALTGPYCPWIHCADDHPRRQPWSIPQRRLAHYLLATSLAGEERVVVDGSVHTIAEGDSYLVPPGALCDLGSAQGSTPAWVHFDVLYDERRAAHPQVQAYATDLGERAALLQPGPRAVWGVDLPVVVPAALAAAFRAGVPRLVACWKRQQRLAVLEATQQLSGLLLSLVSAVAEGAAGRSTLGPEARIARAETLALRQLDAGFDVDDFAAAAGYSRSRFCAVYQRLRRTSPGQWLRAQRMRLAASLLARADLPIAGVGALVGYADPTVFGRVFRAHHGVTPGAWRRDPQDPWDPQGPQDPHQQEAAETRRSEEKRGISCGGAGDGGGPWPRG